MWGGPVVKNLPCNAGRLGSISDQETRIPCVTGQLSPRATTREMAVPQPLSLSTATTQPEHRSYSTWALQLLSLSTTATQPEHHSYAAWAPQLLSLSTTATQPEHLNYSAWAPQLLSLSTTATQPEHHNCSAHMLLSTCSPKIKKAASTIRWGKQSWWGERVGRGAEG